MIEVHEYSMYTRDQCVCGVRSLPDPGTLAHFSHCQSVLFGDESFRNFVPGGVQSAAMVHKGRVHPVDFWLGILPFPHALHVNCPLPSW